MPETTVKPIDTYAVVEMMGHIKLAGRVTEETHFGTVMLRLDIPAVDGMPEHTEYIGGASLFRVTPCTEEAARLVLQRVTPQPAVPFALPRPQMGQREMFVEQGEGDDDEDDGNDDLGPW